MRTGIVRPVPAQPVAGCSRAAAPLTAAPLIGSAIPSRRQIISCSGKDDKGKGPDQGKADFSAYWSLKIKEAFDSRRKYLEEIDRKGIPDSEIAKQIDEKAMDTASEIRDLMEEQAELKKVKLQASMQLKEQIKRDVMLVGGQASDQVAQPNLGASIGSVVQEALRMVRAILLAPFTLASHLRKQWLALFSSQRYENFLMSEGERMWYWRNRTENERWFWEIAFWDRFAFPIICTISYEYLVPNNFIWAVVVPLTFIFVQSGKLPSWRGTEFWLLAYFGFYRKVWPDLAPALQALAFQS